MTREILFRAKSIEDDTKGQWIYGFYSEFKTNKGITCFIDSGDSNESFLVDKATVGQYTGLNDKNGKKIFEGDVILAKGIGYKAVVEWQPDTCRFLAIIINRRSEQSPNFFYVDKGNDRGSQMSSNEVIGTIFDKEVAKCE